MIASMVIASLPTRLLLWRLRRGGLSRDRWMGVVKELARRGEIEDVRIVSTEADS